MVEISDLIARPPGIDYRQFADPFQGYREGLSMRSLPTSGGKIDLNAAIQQIAKAGNAPAAVGMALDLRKQEGAEQAGQNFANIFGGGQPSAPSVPGQGGGYAGAISSVESGGRYDALGPQTKTGDRAYGKYQVMGANIPSWTQEVLGRPMTPQEFLSSQEAQDKVFQAKFGNYVSKYGPEGAARAWFAGEDGMKDPNRSDQLGTTVAQYGQKFIRALGADNVGAPAPEGSASFAPWPAPAASQPQQPPSPQQIMDGGPSIGGRPLIDMLPQLMRAAANPRLPKAQQEMAQTLIKAAIDKADKPNEVKEFLFALGRGDPEAQKGYTTWLRGNKSAGALAITNDMRGESAESKAIGEGAGKRADATISAAQMASKGLVDLSRIETLLNNVAQGKVEPARMTISAWARSLGIPDGVAESIGLDPKGVGNAQAVQALVSQSLISKIGQGGFPANNFSDADRQFLLGSLQQLSNDPKANRIITEAARRVYRRDIDKARAWSDFQRSNKGKSYNEFEIAWADKTAQADIMGDLAKEAQTILGQQRPTQQSVPALSDIDAELRRRGIQ